MNPHTVLLALGILSSSFFGSWHCGAMCGPIVSVMKARGVLASYHLGRLISYVALGAIAGGVGAFFLASSFSWLRIFSALLLTAGLIAMGLRLIFPNGWSGQTPSAAFHGWLFSPATKSVSLPRSGLAAGMLSSLLPCGWLYTYVLAAAATRSASAGALTLLLFWLGGLPILIAVPSLLKNGIAAAGLQQQRIAGGILILCSLYSVLMFYWQV